MNATPAGHAVRQVCGNRWDNPPYEILFEAHPSIDHLRFPERTLKSYNVLVSRYDL